MSKENTALAAEYYVLSILHRLGMDAHLTLGSHKEVDIVIILSKGRVKTVDVKGSATVDWFVHLDEDQKAKTHHYFVFVAYENNFSTLFYSPEIFIVPSAHLKRLVKRIGKQTVLRLTKLQALAPRYKDKWKYLK